MVSIASRSSWGARYQDGVGNRAVGNLTRYFHHSVTKHLSENASVAEERAQVRVIETIGQQRFGRGISYTFIIFPSGRIYQGASVGRISYHSGGSRNTAGVGICLAGNYQANKIGDKAIDAVAALLKHGVSAGWWKSPTITAAHRQFKATSCPGTYAYSAISQIESRAKGGSVPSGGTPGKGKPGPAPSSNSSSSSKSYPDIKLRVDGDLGPLTVKALQQLMEAIDKYDGRIDGSWGRMTTRAVQSWLNGLGYKLLVDGVNGPLTKKALQRFLKRKGLYTGAIDGKVGPMTTRALQSYLNQQRKYLT